MMKKDTTAQSDNKKRNSIIAVLLLLLLFGAYFGMRPTGTQTVSGRDGASVGQRSEQAQSGAESKTADDPQQAADYTSVPTTAAVVSRTGYTGAQRTAETVLTGSTAPAATDETEAEEFIIDDELLPGGAMPGEDGETLPSSPVRPSAPGNESRPSGGNSGGNGGGSGNAPGSGDPGQPGDPQPPAGPSDPSDPSDPEVIYNNNTERAMAVATLIADRFNELTTPEERKAFLGITNNNMSNDNFLHLIPGAAFELFPDFDLNNGLFTLEQEIVDQGPLVKGKTLYIHLYFKNINDHVTPLLYATDSAREKDWASRLRYIDGVWYEYQITNAGGVQQSAALAALYNQAKTVEEIAAAVADTDTWWPLGVPKPLYPKFSVESAIRFLYQRATAEDDGKAAVYFSTRDNDSLNSNGKNFGEYVTEEMIEHFGLADDEEMIWRIDRSGDSWTIFFAAEDPNEGSALQSVTRWDSGSDTFEEGRAYAVSETKEGSRYLIIDSGSFGIHTDFNAKNAIRFLYERATADNGKAASYFSNRKVAALNSNGKNFGVPITKELTDYFWLDEDTEMTWCIDRNNDEWTIYFSTETSDPVLNVLSSVVRWNSENPVAFESGWLFVTSEIVDEKDYLIMDIASFETGAFSPEEFFNINLMDLIEELPLINEEAAPAPLPEITEEPAIKEDDGEEDPAAVVPVLPDGDDEADDEADDQADKNTDTGIGDTDTDQGQPGSDSASDNKESADSDSASDNKESADSDSASDNKESAGSDSASDNKESTDSDSASDNKESADSDSASDNKESAGSDSASDNKESAGSDSASDNGSQNDL